MRTGLIAGAVGAVFMLAAAPAFADDGPFSAAQLDKGKSEYNTHCRECHAKDGKGALGPKLSGDQFKQMFGGQPIGNMRSWIHENMPQNAPGSLPDASLDPIVAYILSLNGYTAGSSDLTADSAKSTQFDPK